MDSVSIPDQLTWVWDRHIRSLFMEPEDEEIKVMKAFYNTVSRLSGTSWETFGKKAVQSTREPFLTRSMVPERRFLGKIIQILPEPFALPSELVSMVLGVTEGQASRVIKWWVGYGLIEVVEKGKSRQPTTYRRRLLK